MTINAYTESTFLIQKMIDWNFIANLKKFKLAVFFSIIVNDEFSICPGIGIEQEKVDFKTSTTVRLTDCYKKMIKDICDFSSTWTGFEAKIFDECVQSNETPVDLNKWEVLKKKEDEIFAGTVNPSSAKYCNPLPGIGSKVVTPSTAGDGSIAQGGLVDTFSRMFYRNIGEYMTGERLDDAL